MSEIVDGYIRDAEEYIRREKLGEPFTGLSDTEKAIILYLKAIIEMLKTKESRPKDQEAV